MKTEATLKEKGARKLEDLKRFAHELNDQLHLEVAEVREKFEDQKKRLLNWLDEVDEKLDHAVDVSKEKAIHLKASIEELRVQAALGRAEATEQLHDQQKKLTKGLHDLKQKIRHLYDTSKEEAHSFKEEVADEMDDFHTRFDLFRLQLHLGQLEAKEEWTEKKKELSRKLGVVKTKISQAENEASEKWEDFSTEISRAWKHFKKAFSN